jgi:hypothetical protein
LKVFSERQFLDQIRESLVSEFWGEDHRFWKRGHAKEKETEGEDALLRLLGGEGVRSSEVVELGPTGVKFEEFFAGFGAEEEGSLGGILPGPGQRLGSFLINLP